MNDDTKTDLSAESEASGRAQSARPRRILVVDDEPAARVLANESFPKPGLK
jgi:hypothetical protein